MNSANPAEWHVRYKEKAFIPLDALLNHSKEWLDAIQEMIERFQGIEHKESTHNARLVFR